MESDKLDSKANLLQESLKIVVENDFNTSNDHMNEFSSQENDFDIDMESNDCVKIKQEDQINEKFVSDENNEDETEFHINLDQVPKTLKNTVLVNLTKYYLFCFYINNIKKFK